MREQSQPTHKPEFIHLHNKQPHTMMAERPLTARMVQKRDDSTITLNVYDVVDHPFHYAVGKMLSCGIHHSGIQVDEREFAFTLGGHRGHGAS